MTVTLLTTSTEMTEKVGETLAAALLDFGTTQAMIALDGEMGVGKTAFTRGFCRALGIFSVKSPTYTVVNEYTGGMRPVYHFDMYRLADEDDLLSVGYEEYLAKEGYLLAEWSERAKDLLPADRITVTIRRTDTDTGREITLALPDALAERFRKAKI